MFSVIHFRTNKIYLGSAIFLIYSNPSIKPDKSTRNYFNRNFMLAINITSGRIFQRAEILILESAEVMSFSGKTRTHEKRISLLTKK